jgi:pyruvate kinase
MLLEGLTVARINMSHGDHSTHAQSIKNARKASIRTKRPVAILQDLSGPKIRIGDFETEDVTLVNGNQLILTTETCIGTSARVFVNYSKLPKRGRGRNVYLSK